MSTQEEPTQIDILQKIANHLERANFSAYTDLLQKPLKLIGLNLAAGIARGVGMTLGAGIVLAVATYIFSQVLSHVFSIPILGQFIAELVKQVQVHMPEPLPPQIR